MVTRLLFGVLLVLAAVVHLSNGLYLDEPSNQADERKAGRRYCKVNGKKYEEGEWMEIPVKDKPLLDSQYQRCKCSGGKPEDCSTYYCESGQKGIQHCEKVSVARGEGCPSCDCFNNKRVKPGKEWLILKKQYSMDLCLIFKCQENKRATLEEKNYVWCDCNVRPTKPCCRALCKSSN